MMITRIHSSCRLFSTASTSGIKEKTIVQPSTKCLQLAVIGAPNVGKSLLTNSLVKCPLSAVSSKMDTTTRNISASICSSDTQLIFVDSPGAVSTTHVRQNMKKKSAADGEKVLQDPERALQRSQHILVVQDSTAPGSYIHHRVLHMLHRYSHVPSTLVMNKIDLVLRRSDLLPLVELLTNGQLSDNIRIATKPAQIGRLGKSLHTTHDASSNTKPDEKWQQKFRDLLQKPTYKCSFAETRSLFREVYGWSGFERVFFCSSLTGEGVDELREHLMGISPSGDWKMDSKHGLTTDPVDLLCMDAVRAAVLDTTPSDVAYLVQVKINEWDEEGEVLQIVAEIRCDKARDGSVVIGKGGRRIAEIGRRVNEHLHSLFQRQLYCRLIVTHNGKLITQAK